jgi:site-specific recombinase XerD
MSQHHNKGMKLPPEPLTKEEVISLMGQCSKRAATGLRDRALIATLYRGQLRISEALALKPSDLDLEQMTVRVLHGKGDKYRVSVIDKGTVEVLAVWMERRKALGINGHAPVFCSLKGKPLATAQIREMLPRRARKAGITKRCNPHNLRHSGASDLMDAGFDIVTIASQLGHSSCAVTARYLHVLNPIARIKALAAREW